MWPSGQCKLRRCGPLRNVNKEDVPLWGMKSKKEKTSSSWVKQDTDVASLVWLTTIFSIWWKLLLEQCRWRVSVSISLAHTQPSKTFSLTSKQQPSVGIHGACLLLLLLLSRWWKIKTSAHRFQRGTVWREVDEKSVSRRLAHHRWSRAARLDKVDTRLFNKVFYSHVVVRQQFVHDLQRRRRNVPLATTKCQSSLCRKASRPTVNKTVVATWYCMV